MTRFFRPFVLVFAVLILISAAAWGQVATGLPPFGSFSGGPADTINNANLNVHISVPVFAKGGRALNFAHSLSYDNSLWTPSGGQWVPDAGWGWRSGTLPITGFFSYKLSRTISCVGYSTKKAYTYSNLVYYDGAGGSHPFAGSVSDTYNCPGMEEAFSQITATDGSGMELYVGVSAGYWTATVTLPTGTVITPPVGTSIAQGSGTVETFDGNTISVANSSSGATFTDTLNTTALTLSRSGGTDTYTYTGPSGNESVTVTYSALTVRTNFGCSGITDYGPTAQNLPTTITLPDQTTYTITYEPTPGYTGDVTGRIASITLPTGGTIYYSYGGSNNGMTCSDGTTPTLTRQTPDGTWTYAHSENGTAWTTTVTAPTYNGQQNQTVMNFQGIYETEREVYQGSSGGTLLSTIDTCYNSTSVPCTGTSITLPISQLTVQTTLPGVSSSKAVTTYNTRGLPTETDDYDFGGSTPLRKTIIPSYWVWAEPAAKVICSGGGSDSICNGAGTLAAETSYTYDGSNHLSDRTIYTSPTASVSQSLSYSPAGALLSSSDFLNDATSFTNGACNSTFPTTLHYSPWTLTGYMTWDCNGAVPLTYEDINGNTTTYSYDGLYRVTGVSYPDGGGSSTSYTGANQIDVYTNLTASGTRHDEVILDSLGRISRRILVSDPQGAVETDIAYDSLGRVASVTNPFRSTSDPTYGETTYLYDGLGRVTSTTAPDGTTTTTTYAGNCATTTDPAGKSRKVCSDALGRVTSAYEDPAGLNLQTTYTYNAMNNLTGVTQGGQTRTYTYDLASRPTQSYDPESGTTTYQYLNSSGNPCSGNLAAICSRTDARGITTTYTYGTFNGTSSVTYSDSTPSASYYYGQSSVTIGNWSSGSLTNTKGRVSEAVTTSGGITQTAVVYSYDSMGRPTGYWQCTPFNCNTSSIWGSALSYDKAGDVLSWSHPEGYTFNNTISLAQQITGVTSTRSDQTHPATLAQSVTYSPAGSVMGLQDGCAGSGCTNIQESYFYDKNWQATVAELGTSTNHSLDSCRVYNYYADATNSTSCSETSWPQGSKNNGNMVGYYYNDNINSGLSHSENYGFDSLNRLISATATGNSTYSQSYAYDRYGNMSCSPTGPGCYPFTYNAANNHITTSGYTYDAAGDLTGDGNFTYQWDAEGRLSAVYQNGNPVQTNTYNALGQRVRDVTNNATIDEAYGADGSLIWRYTGNPNDPNQRVFIPLNGRTLAEYCPTGTIFDHPDAVASLSTSSDYTGYNFNEKLFYPYGELWTGAAIPDFNMHQTFGALPDYDPETDQYNTLHRHYSPFGRWLSPDQVGGDAMNPQSLNRYAYALNNPTTLVDPSGLFPSWLFGPGGPESLLDPGGCFLYSSAGSSCWQDAAATGGVFVTMDPSDPCSSWLTTGASCGQGPGLSASGISLYPGLSRLNWSWRAPVSYMTDDSDMPWWSFDTEYGPIHPLSLNELMHLLLPSAPQGCEFGPCAGLPGSMGNAATESSSQPGPVKPQPTQQNLKDACHQLNVATTWVGAVGGTGLAIGGILVISPVPVAAQAAGTTILLASLPLAMTGYAGQIIYAHFCQ